MAEAIVGPLVGKLQELALSEAKALVAVNDDIRGLRDRLMWTQAFLRHADHRRRDTSDELIRVWLKQTRDVAFDAEDAIDQYFLKVDLSRYPSWTQSVIRFFAGFTTQVSVRHNLSSKIAEINSRLEDIIKNKEKYKIEVAANNLAIMVPWKPSTTISTADTNLDDVQLPSMKRKEQDKLEEELRNPTNNSLVIYVTGESGVGKTTLVREVYERATIKMKFEVQAWSKFPPHLSSSNILQLIHQELTDTDDWLPRKGIDNEVQKELENKTFLLVIDGEVSNTEWNGILSALPDDKKLKKDSRVVRIMHGTTPEVPRGSAAHNRIELSHFDKTTTTDLFHRRLYMEENVEDQKSTITREMGKENKIDKKEKDDKLDMEDIYHITRGLPLAIVLLSGLVKRKEFPNEWRAVFEHLKSKQSKRLDSILTMCFDDLPHDLKSCFLYFAALPMNTPIGARKLICMWMAEGFLRPKYGKTMETVGRIYLKELIARHLVKVVNMDNFSGDDEFVTVHHKVHAFLQLEAQEANFVEIHNGDDIPSLTTARRLSLQNYTDKYAALAYSLPKLRSILSNFQEEIEDDEEVEEEEGEEEEIYRGGHEEKEGEQKEDGDGDGDGEEEGQGKRKEEQEGVGRIEEEVQNRENVGDGENKQKGEEEEEKNIEKGVENEEAKEEVKPSTMPLPNLLRCWGQGASPQVPIKSYIRGMLRVSKFLRVINLQGIEIGEKLPAEIGNVVHLQYLGVTACSLKWIPSTIRKLTNLQTLDVRDTHVHKLPTAFWKIRTLRHVFGNRLVLPKHVGNLKHLQTLETIQHDEDWDSKTFEKMVHLKSIDIRDLSGRDARALFAAIENPEFLEYLVTLTLHVKNIPLCVFTSTSQRRLRAMKLNGKLSMPSEPDFKFCLPNLTLLSLEETRVSQDFINKLGKLPSLANLILDTNSYMDDQLVFCAGGFRCLAKLTISHLKNLKKVEICKSVLPELTELMIVWYPEDIKIVVYGEREFVKKIQLEDENLHAKITQIPIAQKKITQVVASSSA